jgi:Alkylmercury lyase
MEHLHPPYGQYGATTSVPFEFSTDAKRVRRHLELTYIETGRGPSVAVMATQLGLTREATRVALSELQQGVQVMFVPGTEDLLKVPPFSNVPTRHAVSVGGRSGWFAGCAGESCAVDALFPGQEVVIVSSCPDCWQPIELVIRDRHLLSLKPTTAVVHWGMHPRDLPQNWLVGCDRVNFFVDANHARHWEESTTGEPGVITAVELTIRSVDGIARIRHWDYDRGPEVFPSDGGPLLAALTAAGADFTPWQERATPASEA